MGRTPTAPPAPPATFQPDDDPDWRARRPPPGQAGHGTSAFATMFGGALGCAAAAVLAVVAGSFLVVAACGRQPPPADPRPPAANYR